MANLPYNTAALPRWNRQSSDPFSQKADQGYDIDATRVSNARRNAAYKRANATICDGQYWWPLFVTDVNIDFALAGTTAQSRFTRDFYPRNFTQPNFAVQGQSLDEQDYGDLCDFVHHVQRRMLGTQIVTGLTQLLIHGFGFNGGRSSRPGVVKNGQRFPNQLMRGSHQNILALGYVMSMPRQHQKGIYAPTYDFGFVVAEMIEGPYREGLVQQQQQKTWVDVLKSTKTFKVTQDLLAKDKKNLKWAKDNQINILSGGGS